MTSRILTTTVKILTLTLLLAIHPVHADLTFGGTLPAIPMDPDMPTPALPAEWPNTEAPGFFYVDNTHANATDSANPYGTPNRPRASLPKEIGTWPAGTYIELHGGPYESSPWRISSNGTEAQPTWLVGIDNPKLHTLIILERSTNMIIQGMTMDKDGSWIRVYGPSAQRILIRDNDFSGDPARTQNASMVTVNGTAAGWTDDVIVYRNKMHDSGSRALNDEVDLIGVSNGEYARGLWIVENEIYRVGGDAVRVGQNRGRMSNLDGIVKNTYILNNEFYDTGEDAIDFKYSEDTFVMGNNLHNFSPSVSSAGTALVAHEKARRIWVLGNRIADVNIGFANTDGTDVWMVGNVISGVKRGDAAFDPTSLYGSGVGVHYRGASSGGVVGNTFVDYAKGVQIASGSDYEVCNNLFQRRYEPNAFDVMYNNTVLLSESSHEGNLYESFRALVSGNVFQLNQFQQSYNQDQSSTEGVAVFQDEAGGDFRLAAGSPNADVGRSCDVYARYRALYGRDINVNGDVVQSAVETASADCDGDLFDVSQN